MAMLHLPDEITDLFVQKLDLYEDFIRFGAVCKSWQSSASRIKRCFAPWLMLVAANEDDKQKFYSLSSNCVFNLDFFHTKQRKCWGSPFGWLVSYGLDMNLLLVNPFSRLALPLPSHSTFHYQFDGVKSTQLITPEDNLGGLIDKCILSAPPTTPHSCVVLAITGSSSRLSFARPGDEAWITIESTGFGYNDAIFYQGKFYAVRRDGLVSLADISSPKPIAVDFAYPPKVVDDGARKAIPRFYLVEIYGYLHFVALVWYPNYRVRPRHGTIRFKVCKLDFETRQWIQVKDLGNHAVFLGANTSFSILASDFPHCRPNCIYFTDHYDLYRTPVCDMGVYDFRNGMEVYDLRNETLKDIYLGTNTLSKNTSHPIFIMPSF